MDTTTYGSGFVAARIVLDKIVFFHLTLRNLGGPVDVSHVWRQFVCRQELKNPMLDIKETS